MTYDEPIQRLTLTDIESGAHIHPPSVILGDCLSVMPHLKDGSINSFIGDLPYGTPQNAEDVIIDFSRMWNHVVRLLRINGSFISTASQPFTSMLIMSNLAMFKYECALVKDKATGHLNCKIAPMRKHENLVVFGKKKIVYNPQLTNKPLANIRPISRRAPTTNYGKYSETADRTIPVNMTYPSSVIYYNVTNHGERGLHPNQKPVALYEHFVRTYTDEGDLVLDISAGSFTTGVACLNTGRNFIGIEKEEKYFLIGADRMEKRRQEINMPAEPNLFSFSKDVT